VKAGGKQLFLAWLFLNLKDEGEMFLRNVG
jgi:hypothetical protein